MITYVLPTRNRPDVLNRTLEHLGALPHHDAEVIVVDNASEVPPRIPVALPNGLGVRLLFRAHNEGAAARNHAVAASDPSTEWIVMLDDDSHPLSDAHLDVLRDQPSDVAAVAAEILLPRGRESGGLPEVFTGCGVAIRRAAFLDAGGYDPTFNYYVEEYDLAAKFLLDGGRVALDRRFRVMHEKSQSGRNMDLILRRLVRNNAWVMQRYAPAAQRRAELREVFTRYAAIAVREQALAGYTAGAAEALATLSSQPRRTMSAELFDRFSGLAEARASLQEQWTEDRFDSAALVDPGKNARLVRRALQELGVPIVDDERNDADVLVIGTLSPGPMLDSWEQRNDDARRLVLPWCSLAVDVDHIGQAPLIRR